MVFLNSTNISNPSHPFFQKNIGNLFTDPINPLELQTTDEQSFPLSEPGHASKQHSGLVGFCGQTNGTPLMVQRRRRYFEPLRVTE